MEKNQRDKFIPFKVVSEITGIKTLNTIKAKVARDEFPKPVYLSGKCVRWWESEVIAWAKQLPRSFEDYQRRHDDDQAAA